MADALSSGVKIRVLIVGLLLSSTSTADGHSGGLNECGCHFNRKTNECHCHRKSKNCGCEGEAPSCAEKQPEKPPPPKKKQLVDIGSRCPPAPSVNSAGAACGIGHFR